MRTLRWIMLLLVPCWEKEASTGIDRWQPCSNQMLAHVQQTSSFDRQRSRLRFFTTFLLLSLLRVDKRSLTLTFLGLTPPTQPRGGNHRQSAAGPERQSHGEHGHGARGGDWYVFPSSAFRHCIAVVPLLACLLLPFLACSGISEGREYVLTDST